MSFAKHDFSLNQTVDDNGSTLREVLKSAWEQKKARDGNDAPAPAQLIGPPLPEVLVYLWNWFLEIAPGRQFTSFGPLPISSGEILAWSRLNQVQLEPWEVQAIRRLDAAYLASIPKPKPKNTTNRGRR